MDAFADDSDRFSFHAKKPDGYESDEPKKSHAYRDDDRRDRHHDDRRDRDSRRDQDRDRHRRREDSDDRGSKRQRNDGSHGRRDEDEPLPELFSIHKGKVVSIQSYGVFVEMENLRRHGLVHISQATSSRLQGKEDLEQVWVVGDSIWVKVIAIGEDKKISLSAKYVNQGDGRDLDVNQVDLMMADRRKKPGWVERGPIQLDAILHTNCTRCGGKGHIAAECYAAKGQKSYELLDSPPREQEIPKKPEHKHHEDHKHHNEHRHHDEHKHRHDEEHKPKHDDKHKHKDKKEKKDKSEKKHKKHKKDKKDKSEKKHKKED